MNKVPKKLKANTSVNESTKFPLTDYEAKFLGIVNDRDSNKEKAFVVLKYFDHCHECFSIWNNDELKGFTSFISKINSMTWGQIYSSGSKGKSGKKTGFGYTVHKKKSVLPNQNIVKSLSEDITFFELRISQEARVHGFRVKSAFFLVWLDRGHNVYPE
jgi:hypothetical protein